MREEEYYRLQKLSKVYGVTLRTAILIASAELEAILIASNTGS